MPLGTLGHEWDEDLDNGFRPAGLMRLSSTTLAVNSYIQDHGNVYGPGTGTHSLTLYKAPSGALVFGAGTVQWAWGLDEVHDVFTSNPPRPADARMRQATVNLFADMNVQPGTLQSGLVAATASTDATKPTSVITAPADGSGFILGGPPVTIQGTASDQGGGVVGGVEVSTDGGATWHRASGTTSWTYTWTPGGDPTAVIRSRAVDDSGNLELPGAGITVHVTCPCRLWSGTQVPTTPASADAAAVELGVKFIAETTGWITGVRFYKGSGNTGTHTGSLWSTSGTLLARAIFTGESATGWQQAQFDQPVQVNAGTTYVASYHAPNGHYAVDLFYFTSLYENGLLQAPASGTSGGNGVYAYSGTPAFPASTYSSSNYWVDVVYDNNAPVDTTRPTVVAHSPQAGATDANVFDAVSATFSEAIAPATISATTFKLRTAGGTDVPGQVTYNAAAHKATFTPNGPLQPGAAYTATIEGGPGMVADLAGNTLLADDVWSFTTASRVRLSVLALCRPDADRRLVVRLTTGRGRRQVPVGRRRLGDGHPLLQGRGEHGRARRQPLELERSPPRARDVHRRDRKRLAVRVLRRPGGHQRRHDLRRLVPRPPGALCLDRIRARGRRVCSPTPGSGRNERRLSLRRSALLPDRLVPELELLGRRSVHADSTRRQRAAARRRHRANRRRYGRTRRLRRSRNLRRASRPRVRRRKCTPRVRVGCRRPGNDHI